MQGAFLRLEHLPFLLVAGGLPSGVQCSAAQGYLCRGGYQRKHLRGALGRVAKRLAERLGVAF
jgi:hypothetical protein